MQAGDLVIKALPYNKKDTRYFEARHPTNNLILGFISHSRKTGVVELANYHAQLQRRALFLGGSTKAEDEEAAGMYGEGMKCAAVILLRHNYQVRYATGEMLWKFIFDKSYPKRQLYCLRSKIRTKKILEQSKKWKPPTTTKRTLVSNGCIDVSVCIGNVYGTQGKHITEETFESWMRLSLDLNPISDTDVIKTSIGWLLFDEAYKSQHYLKGLLLESTPRDKYEIGYNFLRRKCERDRSLLTDSYDASEMIAQMWREAILAKDDKKEVLKRYLKMLMAPEGCKADITNAEDYITEDIAKLLLAELNEMYKAENPFYFQFGENVMICLFVSIMTSTVSHGICQDSSAHFN
jgi:hypothetical protein